MYEIWIPKTKREIIGTAIILAIMGAVWIGDRLGLIGG